MRIGLLAFNTMMIEMTSVCSLSCTTFTIMKCALSKFNDMRLK